MNFVNFVLFQFSKSAYKLNAIIEKIAFNFCSFALVSIRVFFCYTPQFLMDYNKNITFDIIDQTPDRYWEKKETIHKRLFLFIASCIIR